MNVDELPYVNWPSKDGASKFVQIYVDERPLIRFANHPGERNHSQIAIGLFEMLGLDYYVDEKESQVWHTKVPELNGDRYDIVGGGVGVVYGGDSSFRIFEEIKSETFRRGINYAHLDEISRLVDGWEFNFS